jgi:uncharacterized protein
MPLKFIISVFTFLLLAAKLYSQVKNFPLSQVRLSEGPFLRAQQTDLRYILALEPDRLLSPFLREAGITPQAPGYGNWEGTGLDGHIGGHYLTALSNMYAATGNAEVLRRLNYMINWLDSCQRKNANGYVGAIPGGKAMWQEIAAGKIDAGSFSLNNKWVPWYNIHKLYAGLLDAYIIAGNKKAKDMLIRLSDWCLQLASNLSDAQMQQMMRAEHGGMNEIFAHVFTITGNNKYLDLARRFSDRRILNPLLQAKDSLTGMHANTQIPKVIGYKQIAMVSGENDWASAAEFFWHTVVHNRSVVIGGNSVREHFHPATDFSSMMESKEGPETCNSYNMLKLTKQLFLTDPSSKYADYYERTLYNHILASQHPQGGFVYFTPMRPRHYRVYSQPQQGFWCCVGSGMENHSKYGELIYAHDGKNIFVNLFIPSVLSWKEKGIVLKQNTQFPFTENSTITLTMPKPSKFALLIRYPSWVEKGKMKVMVNNKPVAANAGANGYISVEQLWKTGDKISVHVPMHTTVEALPDKSAWVSFLHGPIVLAAATGKTDLKGLRADDSRMGHIANDSLYPVEDAPILQSTEKVFATAIKPVAGKPLTFSAASLIYPARYNGLELVPFFQLHDARYMVYWPVSTPEELDKKKQALREQEQSKLALEARTADQVAPGEQQPESDHNFQGERTESGVHRDRHWRHAAGWFSYDLKNTGKAARTLRITYFGLDNDRHFDIYLNDKLFQAVHLDGKGGDNFVDADYTLPEELRNLNTIRIKFAAHTGSVAGGIYYVRLLR